MALSSAARTPPAHPATGSSTIKQRLLFPVLWSAFVTSLIAAPWLGDGYLFGTDWPGPRRLDFPSDVSSSYLLRGLLALASSLTSAEVTGKLFVITVLLVAGATSYAAVPVDGFVARASGSLVYVLNPFVYGRLHYGQLFLLAAYASLPWVAIRLRKLAMDPRWTNAVMAALSLVVLGILSPQVFLMAWGFGGVVLIVHLVVRARAGSKSAAALLLQALVVAGCALAASSYWIVPLILGRGSEGTSVALTGPGQLAAYAAVPDAQFGLLPNLLGLYGFWAEDVGRFTSMKNFVPLWPAILAAILIVAAIGVFNTFRERSNPLIPWVAALLVTASIAVVLEAGEASPLTSWLVRWLDSHISLYRGMRDSAKWAVILALVYSQLVGLGSAAILNALSRRLRDPDSTEWAIGVGTAIVLVLPLYYGNGLLFGVHGEIKPSHYPSGWYTADGLLTSDSHPGRTLVLPWHEYMAYSFVHNQNSVVSSPAPSFFSVPILSSLDAEVPGVAPPTSSDQVAVAGLVAAGPHGEWAKVLAGQGVRYILLAREVDWKTYSYLDGQPGLTKIGDFGSIVVYRDELTAQAANSQPQGSVISAMSSRVKNSLLDTPTGR